jgi:hypothetical protein
MFLGKEVRILLKGQAKEAYEQLREQDDKEAKAILNSFNRIRDVLRENPQYGDPIAKHLIPHKFRRMGVQNLYRVRLSNYWRALYTIEGSVVEIFVFFLVIADHREYDKLFGYRKK